MNIQQIKLVIEIKRKIDWIICEPLNTFLQGFKICGNNCNCRLKDIQVASKVHRIGLLLRKK
jgi:hypothetical protein